MDGEAINMKRRLEEEDILYMEGKIMTCNISEENISVSSG